MARMSIEQKLADKVVDATLRADFDAPRFAYIMNRCGWKIQEVLFQVVLGMIRHWAIDLETDNTKGGADEYYRLTIKAKILQDAIDRNKIE
jgi:hypothetical protein